MQDSEIVIDIRTRVISQEERAFVLFPGEAHKFYVDFSNNSHVFLDFPGLDLSNVFDPDLDPDWTQRIAMSEKIRAWHRKGRPEDDLPARHLSAYDGYKLTPDRALYAGAIHQLYYKLKRGELLIVPGPGYWTDVLVGEIADEPGQFGVAEIEGYQHDQIPARKVRWLGPVDEVRDPEAG